MTTRSAQHVYVGDVIEVGADGQTAKVTKKIDDGQTVTLETPVSHHKLEHGHKVRVAISNA